MRIMALRRNTLLLALGAGFSLENAAGHGYMSSPRSRNLLAFEETIWWPQTENDPQPETCPHCLNRGGSLAQCGIAQEQRNYDAPRNALGGPMPTKIQATYSQGQDVILDVTLTAHHKGHFVFSACPISYGDVPSQECFDENKLTFVEDLLHGANFDQNFPERAYIVPVNDPNYVPNFGSTVGVMEFSFKMRLPSTLFGDLVLIQWYYLTANSCVHEGYQEYNWPDSWDVNQINTADLCGDVSSDGSGVPEQFWNCAEVKIIQDSNALMSNPTNRPTPLPTPSQFSSQAGAPVSLPSASSNSNPSPSENAQSSSRTHDKTIVGYYASWQWYDRNKLAEPANMDFSKLQRVNFAFFQIDPEGNMWGTDSWADPNLLFGPYNWNPASGSTKYCSWDTPTDKVCNYHDYEKGLINLVHKAGAEIYPSIGGWTLSDPFPAMSASPNARAKFTQNCVNLIIEYGFDGIDIDWEYPGFDEHSGTPQDTANFKLLLDDVRAKLDELGAQTGKFYGLTAALPCGPNHIANMDIAHVASTLSELNLMTYDFHGAWSETSGANAPIYYQGWGEEDFSVHDCVNNWLAGGGTRDKINIGLPFYGRSFLSSTGFNQPHDGADQMTWGTDDGTPQYFNIVAQLPYMTSVWDKPTWTQYAYFGNGGLVSFDNENAICAKTEYAIENNLNGFIIWELSGDVMPDLTTPLLDVVNKKLANPSFICGETGYYPDDDKTQVIVPAPLPSPTTPITVPSPGKVPEFSESSSKVPASLGSNPNNPTPVSSPTPNTPDIPGTSNQDQKDPLELPVNGQPIFLVCGNQQGSFNIADTNSVKISFNYELHRQTSSSLADAIKGLKSSILNGISSILQCGGVPSSLDVRRLSMLRRNQAVAQQHVVAIESTLSDSPANVPCSIPVNLSGPTVCHSMIGSLTAYFEKGTSLPILQTSKEELLFSIRTSMASGRYESSSVKKVIYVEELYNSPIKANAVIEWKPESAERNYSTLIAIVLGSFFAVITGVLLFVLVRRRKEKSQTYRVNQLQRAEDDSVSTLSQPEPHVEDVWQKALNTWNAPYHQQQQQQHKQLVEPTSTAKQHNKFGAVASTQNTQEGYSNTAVFTEEDTPEAALSKTIGSLENNLQIEDDNVGIEQELDTEEDEDDHVSIVDDRDEEHSLPGEVEGIEQSLERNGHQDEESFNTSSDNEDQYNSVLEDSVHDQLLETEVGQDSYPDDETTPSPDDETESTCQIDPKGEYDNTQLNEDEINELTDDSKKNVSSEKN